MPDRAAGTRSRRFLTLALCGLLAASAAFAQNLLPNPGFNTDIAGWTPNYSGGLSLAWNSLDAKGSSGSGSLQITNSTVVDNNGYNVFGICVAVTPGLTYHEGASFYFPSGQSQSAFLAVSTQFYSSADCSTGYLGTVSSPVLSPAADTWQRVDTQPFVAPEGAGAAFALFASRKVGDTGSIVCDLDDVVFELVVSSLCYWSDEQLCLGSRFRVTARWTSSTGSGTGHAVALVSDTGSFWFFTPANLEMLVKVLDACLLNGKKWVFGGGLTNVQVDLTVLDLLTGAQQTYTNPLNTAFAPIQDTAFGLCP